MQSETVSIPHDNVSIEAQLHEFGEECLRLFDSMRKSTIIDWGSVERRGLQLCLAYFLAKLQQSTRAALTLICLGQGSEALSLLRENNEFSISLQYYAKHSTDAQLFVASHVIRQLEFANKLKEFEESLTSDSARRSKFRELEGRVRSIIGDYPGLHWFKSTGGKNSRPKEIYWSEPSSYKMYADLIEGWMRAKNDLLVQPLSGDSFEQEIEKQTKRAFFFRSTYLSQGKHGTAFDAATLIDVDSNGIVKPIRHQVDDPKHLFEIFIWNCLHPFLTYRNTLLPGKFEPELRNVNDRCKTFEVTHLY